MAGWQFCLAQPSWLSAIPWANRRGDQRAVSTIVDLEVELVGSGAGDGERGQLSGQSWSDVEGEKRPFIATWVVGGVWVATTPHI